MKKNGLVNYLFMQFLTELFKQAEQSSTGGGKKNSEELWEMSMYKKPAVLHYIFRKEYNEADSQSQIGWWTNSPFKKS